MISTDMLKGLKGVEKNMKRKWLKSFMCVLAVVILPVSLPLPVCANETVQVAVSNSPIVDVYLAKGISQVETKTFRRDLLNQMQKDGYNTDQMQVNEIKSAEVNVSTAFNWEKDVSSVIGSIKITGNGQHVDMYGNSSEPGKNAIWTFLAEEYQQKFTFGYNIDFGDSFNAAGMLLKVKRDGNTLSGYMLSFNNTRSSPWNSNGTGAVWKFTYNIGTNSTNMIPTILQSLPLNTSGTLTIEVGKENIAISGGGLSSTQVIVTESGYGNGFGFFADHYSHNCDSIGQFSLTNINLTQTNVKTITDVLKTPEWRDNSTRMLCNVNDYSESDFQTANDLSQTLMRTINENIHYVSWGNSGNKSSNTSFITKNNQKGIFIDSGNHSNSIKQTAAYIEQVIDSYQSKQYVAVEEPIKLQIMPNSLAANTVTTDFPSGRWKIDHDYTYFANDQGKYVASGVYQNNMPKTFDKVGKYSIYFADDLVKEVFVHRMPVASFSPIINGAKITYRTNSMDMDSTEDIGYGVGIAQEEWFYRESSSSSWSKGKLDTFNPKKVYLIQLRVKDEQGVWSDPVVKFLSSTSNTPVADFSFGSNRITEYDKLNIVDNSYDPSGKALTNYQWVLKKGNSTMNTTSQPITDFNTKNLGVGTYSYSLKVKNSAGVQSDNFTRLFQVVKYVDTIPPTIDYVKYTRDGFVVIKMSDNEHGDGVKGVYINGVFKARNPVVMKVPENVAVLRLQAEDNAGNKSAIRRELVPDRTVIVIESVVFAEDNKTATITAAINDPETSVRGIYCNGELIEGNPVTYKIPIENSQYLKVQAVSKEDDKSEIVTKRVPGWSEVVDTIAVTSVEFLNDDTMARVRADTTRLDGTIMGIYVNDTFFTGNPIECNVAEGTEYLKCQAIDEWGDMSQLVVRQVPVKPVPEVVVEKEKSKSGGGGTGSTTFITISQPVLQDNGEYCVNISAKDSESGIKKIVAIYDGRKEDVTKSGYILLDKDTYLQVLAVNGEDRNTYKKVWIHLNKEKPVVEEVPAETPAASDAGNARPNSHNGNSGYHAPAGSATNASSMDGSTSSAKEERLERLLKEQKLKQQHVEESDPDPIDEQSEDVETYVSMSSPNRPGMATIIASSLCFLALLIIVAILVIKQYKDSDFCKKQNVKKE